MEEPGRVGMPCLSQEILVICPHDVMLIVAVSCGCCWKLVNNSNNNKLQITDPTNLHASSQINSLVCSTLLTDTNLKGTAEPLDLLLQLLDVLLSLLLFSLQASLGFLTPLEVLVQAVHFLFQGVLPASGCFSRLLCSLKFFIEFLHTRL